MRTDKDKAFALRQQGKSYRDICDKLGISKSTLSNWFKGVDFSEKIRKSLVEESRRTSSARIKDLNRTRGETLRASYEVAKQEAQMEMEKYKNDPLFISAVFAYWGEGDKLSRNQVRLTNTDPKMIQIFLEFLLIICKVPIEKIKLALFIYTDLNETVCKNFWSDITGIQKFHKTQVLPSRHKTKKLPHGVCTVVVSNTYLKKKINLWIDQLPEMVLNRTTV
ncbi:helix-turn-helix domain-containing protein [Candidatus Kaiserbacteria bacterium]|nr:helix-turn-helix domain-containing protein [Candidatus Kaiserbacteria bacterium]USN92522.1 MAG: helix-turn-helix domain-containing protein [Candidatus Nomurabacteria bacterium]